MAVSKTRGADNRGQKLTPEIYFARKLAANDKKTRDKTLKKLKKWVTARSSVPDAFSECELLKLWKGLFYCMWMSDKPLIQEDLAETISSLLHSIVDRQTGLKFIKVALLTMAREWGGIDTWRMEKFLMFVRRILRHSFQYLANRIWDQNEVDWFNTMFSESIVNANISTAQTKVPVGLQLHLINIYLEELAKVGKEELPSDTIIKFLEPFAKCLATTNDGRLKKEITQHIFTYLIKQSDVVLCESDDEGGDEQAEDEKSSEENEGDDAEEAIVDLEDDGSEMDEGGNDDDMEIDFDSKDPRAGGVNVTLPQLRPDFSQLADMVFREASKKTVRTKNRKPMYQLFKKFRDAARGINPLKVVLPNVGNGLTPSVIKRASKRWIEEELELSKKLDAERLSFKSTTSSSGSKRKKTPHHIAGCSGKEDETDSVEDDLGSNDLDEEDSDNHDLDEEDGDEEDGDEEDGDEEDFEDEEGSVREGKKAIGQDDGETRGDEEQAIQEQPAEPVSLIAPTQCEVTVEVKKKKRKAGEGESSSAAATLAQFKVDEDWDVEPTSSSMSSVAHLKKKIKAPKKMLSSWTESPLTGEVEIVIPNKKYKGAVKMTKASPPEEEAFCAEPANGCRRVKISLDKNMSQEPKDYQESVRKSPGIPHDPHRQPPSGGVLKRMAASTKHSKGKRNPNARLFPRT